MGLIIILNCFKAKTETGLVRGHAYSVTKVIKAEIDTGRKKGLFPLIRLRNPWGNSAEWNGDWSDGSRAWTFIPQEEKLRMGLVFEHDGEFYMSRRDLMTHFESLEICHLSPDTMGLSMESNEHIYWNNENVDGSWKRGITAGGCRNYLGTFEMNPQYLTVLEDTDEDDDEMCTIIIGLMQKGSRRRKAENDEDGALTIGITFNIMLHIPHCFAQCFVLFIMVGQEFR